MFLLKPILDVAQDHIIIKVLGASIIDYFSNIFEKSGSIEIGLLFSTKHGSSALNIGITLTIFSLAGKIPEVKDKLIICNNGSQIKPKDFLMIHKGRLAVLGAFPSLKLKQFH